MKRANTGELRNHLSRYLEHVRSGGEIVIFDRNRPIARIVAISASGRSDDNWLARLERRNLVRAGAGGLPAWFGRRRPTRVRGSVLRDLLAEREEGR